MPVGLIGTVRYEIGSRVLPAPRTTPESADLHDLLAQMKIAGCRSAVMEVSSHALEQGRVEPIEFQVGVFTNLTQDHLDYHESMENYFAAKAILFTNLDREKRPGVAVINADDPYGVRIMKLLGGRVRVLAYTVEGRPGAKVEASDLIFDATGTRGTLRIGPESFPFALPLLGTFNVANALAATGAALALGVPPHVIVERLHTVPQVPGRLEKFMSKDGVTAAVDYAHTDDAVKKVLSVLRGITKGRLIVVLGCGGNRDAVKRPLDGARGDRERRLRDLHGRQSAPGKCGAHFGSHGNRRAGRRVSRPVRESGRSPPSDRAGLGAGQAGRRGLRGWKRSRDDAGNRRAISPV